MGRLERHKLRDRGRRRVYCMKYAINDEAWVKMVEEGMERREKISERAV